MLTRSDQKTSVTEQEQPVASLPASEAPEPETAPSHSLPVRNGAQDKETPPSKDSETVSQHDVDDATGSDTTARLEAMAKERDDLRSEVAELRKSLEEIQEKHQEELSGLRGEVEDAQSARENAESQYRTLLGKVNTIRSQLGERLKADAVRPEATPLAAQPHQSLTQHRKSFRKHARRLKSSKSRTVAYRKAMTIFVRPLPNSTQREMRKPMKSRHSVAGPTSLSRTGSKSGMSSSAERLSRERSLKAPSRPCKTGRFWQWKRDPYGKISAIGLLSLRISSTHRGNCTKGLQASAMVRTKPLMAYKELYMTSKMVSLSRRVPSV